MSGKLTAGACCKGLIWGNSYHLGEGCKLSFPPGPECSDLSLPPGSFAWCAAVGGADRLALALHLKAIGTFKLNMQSYLGEALNGRLLDY